MLFYEYYIQMYIITLFIFVCTVYPRFNALGGVTFCKKSAKRLFILFCQFLLGKKIILGPEGGRLLEWGR